MPAPVNQAILTLEHGTIKRLLNELRASGEHISYTGLTNRIYRLSHYDTIQRALDISDSIKAEKAARRDRMTRLINNKRAQA